jgi:glycosyltransferase involved in cell wall biosynthesis
VAALERVRQTIPRVELRIYGQRTPFLEKVMSRVRASGLEELVRYFGAKDLEEIAEAIRQCDVGVIPNRKSIFTQINTPTRIFEYLSQGKPVIAPSVPGILDYFAPEDLLFFELGNADDLAQKLEYAFTHPEEVSRIVRRAQEVYLDHRWSSERERFLNVLDDLLGGETAHSMAAGAPEGDRGCA